MKFVGKTLFYLFIASSILIFGYVAIKYTRDTVRIWNAKTLAKTIDLYNTKNGSLPESGPDTDVSKFLIEKNMLSQEIRDPVFTSSTVMMDEYAFTLLKIYKNISGSADSFFEMKDAVSEFIDDNKTEDEEVNKQLEDAGVDLNSLLGEGDGDLPSVSLDSFSKEELDKNMQQLEELTSKGIAADHVIAYLNEDGKYEISVKLESPFMKSKMVDDKGNDDERYEVGTNLELDTSLIVDGENVAANNPAVSIIK